MSISAPEAHSSHLPDKITRGAEEYANGSADFDDATTEEHQSTDERLRAGDRYRERLPGEQARGRQLARTALIAGMAGELLQRARGSEAPDESRRLAIELASTAIGRHYALTNRQQNITRRHM